MGSKTLNDIFYKPDIGASGAVEKGKFDDGLDDADGLIEANKPANNKLSALAVSTSADLAGVISDKTGTGKAVFGTLPTINKINLSEGNIIFPAVQVAAAGVNTLDDYEEGNWTPDLQFGGAKVGITYNTQNALYIKIGNLVYVSLYIHLSSIGTSVGGAAIEGLPFSVKTGSRAFSVPSVYAELVSYIGTLVGMANTGGSNIAFREITEGGSRADIDNTDFAGGIIRMNMTYVTD